MKSKAISSLALSAALIVLAGYSLVRAGAGPLGAQTRGGRHDHATWSNGGPPGTQAMGGGAASKTPDGDLLEDARLLLGFGEAGRAWEILGGSYSRDSNGRSLSFRARVLTEMGLFERAESLLADTLVTKEEDEFFLHQLRRARLSFLAGKHKKALDILSSIDTISSGTFDAYRDLLRLEALVGKGGFEEASDLGEQLLRAGPPPSLSPEFEENLLVAFTSSGRFAEAIDLIERLKKKFRKGRTIQPFLEKEVELLLVSGDSTIARKRAYQVAKDFSSEEVAFSLSRTILSAFPLRSLTADELLLYGEISLGRGEIEAARSIRKELQLRGIPEAQEEKVRFFLALVEFKEKKYERTLLLLKRGFLDKNLARRAALLVARAHRRAGKPLKAAAVYEGYCSFYPFDKKAPEALFVASGLYEVAGRREKSREVSERLQRAYPNSYYGKLSAVRMAVSSIRRGDHTRGTSLLEEALRLSSSKDEAALFYLARGYEKMGKKEKKDQAIADLLSINPNSFYLHPFVETRYELPALSDRGRLELRGERGLLRILRSISATREDAYRRISKKLPPGSSPGIESRLEPFLTRAKLFLVFGFRDWAERELELLESRLSSSQRSLFDLGVLYNANGMVWRSVGVFQKLRDSLPPEGKRELESAFDVLLYPTPFPGLLLENCIRYRLPPHLVYAIIREESRFDIKAVSRAGALGLMQLMPKTGEGVARELELTSLHTESFFIPEINLSLGMRYASFLLKRCKGDFLMMLASYNAGFENAKRWFWETEEKSSTTLSIDRIDFKETRRYVKKTVESARVYFSLYFSSRSGIEPSRS